MSIWEIVAGLFNFVLVCFVLGVITDILVQDYKRKKKRKTKYYISPENKKRLAALNKEIEGHTKTFEAKKREILSDIEKETKAQRKKEQKNGKEK